MITVVKTQPIITEPVFLFRLKSIFMSLVTLCEKYLYLVDSYVTSFVISEEITTNDIFIVQLKFYIFVLKQIMKMFP